MALRKSQNSDSNFQELKWPKWPGGRSNPIGFISKTTGLSINDFIGWLMKNPDTNRVNEAGTFSSLTDITQDSDVSDVCSIIMNGHQSVNKCFLYRNLKWDS